MQDSDVDDRSSSVAGFREPSRNMGIIVVRVSYGPTERGSKLEWLPVHHRLEDSCLGQTIPIPMLHRA